MQIILYKYRIVKYMKILYVMAYDVLIWCRADVLSVDSSVFQSPQLFQILSMIAYFIAFHKIYRIISMYDVFRAIHLTDQRRRHCMKSLVEC